MGKEKVSKLIVRFAIPTIAAILVNAVYNTVDAISVAFPIFMLILGIGLTFGTGAASYISRLLGKGDITTNSIELYILKLSLIGFHVKISKIR